MVSDCPFRTRQKTKVLVYFPGHPGDFLEEYNLSMKIEQISIPEKDSEAEDKLAQEKAEDEGMIQHEWTDEELVDILADDLISGSTPG